MNKLIMSLLLLSCMPSFGQTPVVKSDKLEAGFTYTVSDTNRFAPLTVLFVNTSKPGNSDVLSYEWSFGDGTTSQEVNPEHTYTKPQTYIITLAVTDTLGGESEYQDYVVVRDTAQTGEFEFIESGCYNEGQTPPCGYEKHCTFGNGTLNVYGSYYGNCGTYKTATIRQSGDTIKIRTWEVGMLTTCSCSYCFEIVIPEINFTPIVLFNNELMFSASAKEKLRSEEELQFTNPVADKLIFRANSEQLKDYSYSIVDLNGRLLKSGVLLNDMSIDVSNLDKGIYLVHLLNQDGTLKTSARFFKE